MNSNSSNYAIPLCYVALMQLVTPVAAQSDENQIVRITGFLGDLRFAAEEVRADISGSDPDMPQIAIAMNDAATAAFAAFTTTHINQPVTFFVCGQEVLSATVQAPIDTGFTLTAPLPVETAAAMVDALNGQGACPDPS